MSLTYSVDAFIPGNGEFKKMYNVYEACNAASVPVPPSTMDYFSSLGLSSYELEEASKNGWFQEIEIEEKIVGDYMVWEVDIKKDIPYGATKILFKVG